MAVSKAHWEEGTRVHGRVKLTRERGFLGEQDFFGVQNAMGDQDSIEKV